MVLCSARYLLSSATPDWTIAEFAVTHDLHDIGETARQDLALNSLSRLSKFTQYVE